MLGSLGRWIGLEFYRWLRTFRRRDVRVPRSAHNKMPTSVKKRYFELLREGYRGAAAARVVGVSTSCGSVWFLDAGGMIVADRGPISPRFLTQDDRIAIADGLHAGHSVKQVAAEIGKSFQSVYKEIQRNSKPDGRYQPWWAHNQALLRRRRPTVEKIRGNVELRKIVGDRLGLPLVSAADLPLPGPYLPTRSGQPGVSGDDLSGVVRWLALPGARQIAHRPYLSHDSGVLHGFKASSQHRLVGPRVDGR